MIETYDFERHPLQNVVETCDSTIASYRKTLFNGFVLTSFNAGMLLIQLLNLWAEMPWAWGKSWATVFAIIVHAVSLIIAAWTWRWVHNRRQRWVNLRQSCLNAMKAQSHIAAEFHLDQIHAAFAHLNKL
jgi:hypothetical protein